MGRWVCGSSISMRGRPTPMVRITPSRAPTSCRNMNRMGRPSRPQRPCGITRCLWMCVRGAGRFICAPKRPCKTVAGRPRQDGQGAPGSLGGFPRHDHRSGTDLGGAEYRPGGHPFGNRPGSSPTSWGRTPARLAPGSAARRTCRRLNTFGATTK